MYVFCFCVILSLFRDLLNCQVLDVISQEQFLFYFLSWTFIFLGMKQVVLGVVSPHLQNGSSARPTVCLFSLSLLYLLWSWSMILWLCLEAGFLWPELLFYLSESSTFVRGLPFTLPLCSHPFPGYLFYFCLAYHPLSSFFRGDWSWNFFNGHSLLSADSRRAVVSFWRKNVHNTG